MTSTDNIYDIVTVGLYGRKADEVTKILQDLGITQVIDARATRYVENEPGLGKYIESTMKKSEMNYVQLPALDGKSKNPELHVGGDASKPVDYSKVAATPEFQSAAQTVLVASNEGKSKVAVLIGSAAGKYSNGAQLIGQYLEKYSDLTVGHLEASGESITSQRDAVERSLLPFIITSGSYKDVTFDSNGRYTLNGVKTEKGRTIGENITRTIDGEWNFGSEGQVTESTLGQRENLVNNAHTADVAIDIRHSFYSPDAKAVKETAENYIRVKLPVDREEYINEEGGINQSLVNRLVTSIQNQMNGIIAKDLLTDPRFDHQSINVSISGTHIASLSNEWKEMKVTEDELDKTNAQNLRNTDTHIVEMTGPTQEIVNELMAQVLAKVRTAPVSEEDPTAQPLYRIGSITTDGETGVAEAATIAAQREGMDWKIVAAHGFAWTRDNETTKGEVVRDEVSFTNRFRQGMEMKVTDESLVADAQQENTIRRWNDHYSDDGTVEPGLTDNQIALLQMLGFDSQSISQMIDLAKENGVIITDSNDMLGFIEDCGAYGIEAASEFNAATIENATERLENLVKSAEEKGISFVTINNPKYPQRLAEMEPFKEKGTETIFKMENGVASFEDVEVDREVTAPPILWVKGNLDAINADTCSIQASEATVDPYDLRYADAKIAPDKEEYNARELGASLGRNKVNPVVCLQSGPEMTVARSAMDHGAKPVVMSSEPIDSPRLSDYTNDVVRNGGVVISEQAPANGRALSVGDEQSRKRARNFSLRGAASVAVLSLAEGNHLGAVLVTLALPILAIHNIKNLAYDRFKKRFADKNVTESEGTANIETFVRSISSNAKAEEARKNAELNSRVAKNVATRKQMPIEVLYAEGKKPIFLVPENRNDIRTAIMKTYAQAQIESPSRKAAIMSSLYGYPAGKSWKEGDGAYYGDSRCAPQKPVVSEDRVFYDKGEIHTLSNAPKSFPGLLPLPVRRANISQFEAFKREIGAIRDHQQEVIGAANSVPLFFAEGLHVTIARNRVAVYNGTELKAEVCLKGNGSISYKNYRSLSSDLEEHGKRELPLLHTEAPDTAQRLKELSGQIGEALLGLGHGESDELALATREEREALAQEIETGFRSTAADNLDLTSRELLAGIADGTVADMALHRLPEPALLFYNADRQSTLLQARKEAIAVLRKDEMKQLEEAAKDVTEKTGGIIEMAGTEGVSATLVDKVTAFVELIQDEASPELIGRVLDEMKASVTDIGHSDIVDRCQIAYEAVLVKQNYLETVQNLMTESRGIDKSVSSLKEAQAALAQGAEVRIAAVPGEESASRFQIGGRVYDIPSGSDGTSLEEMSAMMDRYSLDKLFDEGQSATRTVDRTTFHVFEGMASKEEIKSAVSCGRCIVERDGKMAYADKYGRIKSEFYDEVKVFGGKFGLGMVSRDGKYQLVDRDGNELLPTWASGIGNSHEGYAQIDFNGWKTLLNTATIEVVGERTFPRLDVMSQGWARVADERGLMNYIDGEGRLYSKDEWFAHATNFNEAGLASVTLTDGSKYIVDTEGKGISEQEARRREQERSAAAAEKSQQTHKR